MSTATTPENVAKVIASNLDGDYEASPHCWVRVSANGPVVEIDATPYGGDGVMQPDAKKHFRAVVVEGDQTPIVLVRPAELGLFWYDGGPLLAGDSEGVTLHPRGLDEWDMTSGEARELAAHLVALAVQAEAQTGGEVA